MQLPFRDRVEAGKHLADTLMVYRDCVDVMVMALPRGGVPVAQPVALALQCPLDVCLVRKVGVPGQRELAMGAIAPGGIMVVNQEIVQAMGISRQALLRVARQEQKELDRRQRLYRGNCPLPNLRDRLVIVVDDGIATGSTLRAAIATLQAQKPRSIVVAVPIGAAASCDKLALVVDRVVCLAMPEPMQAIGQWYLNFAQTTDAEVQRLLQPFLQSCR